jgi:hypothetical protein
MKPIKQISQTSSDHKDTNKHIVTKDFNSKGVDTLVGKLLKINKCEKSSKGYWALDFELFEDDEHIFSANDGEGAF